VTGLESFSLVANETTEETLASGEIVHHRVRREIYVYRPGRVAVLYEGDDDVRHVLLSDEKLTIFSQAKNAYSETNMPPTIGDTLDKLSEDYGFNLPLADLIHPDLFNMLTAAVDDGAYVGQSRVLGKTCHHLTFDQENLDWEIWIEDGDQPVPRQVVITYHLEDGTLRYEITMPQWTAGDLPAETFELDVPADADRMDFLPHGEDEGDDLQAFLPVMPPMQSILDGQQNLYQLFGPRTTADDVRGKVVLVYFMATDGLLEGSLLPNLVDMQKRYNSSGRFAVMVSHVTDGPGRMLELCRQYNVNFPVFQQLYLPGMSVSDVPYAYLFDHNAQLAYSGYPLTLQNEARPLIMAAGPRPSPMLGDLEVAYFSREAHRLRPGEAIRSPLRSIEGKIDRDDASGAEAEAISRTVRAWIDHELAQAEALADSQPAQAAAQLQLLAKTLRGMEEADQVNELLASLQADENVEDLAQLCQYTQQFQQNLWVKGCGRTAERAQQELLGRFDSYLQREDLTSALRAEAEQQAQRVSSMLVTG
jgi:hypothetical protein